MINEERIALMTRMAAYEEGEGRENIAVGKYFRSDYIGLQVLKSVIGATLAFAVALGLYILYDFEAFMQDIYKLDVAGTLKNLLILYGVCMVVYGIISYLVYSYRYSRARENLKQYYNNLKKLNSLYED